MSLVAGIPGGQGHLDGIGTSARFGTTSGVAIDHQGNVYVADTCTIRRIELATGEISTLAGSFKQCATTDGRGPEGRFEEPSQAYLASDGIATLYVSDHGAVRMVQTATGEVTTIVRAPLDSARGLVRLGTGDLYVADYNVVRRVVAGTGEITTFLGSADCGLTHRDGTGAQVSFGELFGLATDGIGNLYVLEGRDTLRRVEIATRTVATLGRYPFMGIDVAGGDPEHLYVLGNQKIQDIALSTRTFTTVAATPGGQFLAASDGSAYVAGSSEIRTVTLATGDVTPLAGATKAVGTADGIGGVARFTLLGAAARADDGSLYVLDGVGIRRVVLATGEVTTFAESLNPRGDNTGVGPRFSRPAALTIEGGNLYVADSDAILQVVLATGEVTAIATGLRDEQGEGPTGLASDHAGNLYVTLFGEVRKVVISSGAVTRVVASPMLGYPAAITSDGGGNLYISAHDAIRKLEVDTLALTLLAGLPGAMDGLVDGLGSSARFGQAGNLVSDGGGHLFVADGSTIRKIDVATGMVSTYVGSPEQIGVGLGCRPTLNAPSGMAVLPGGELAVVDSGENVILLAYPPGPASRSARLVSTDASSSDASSDVRIDGGSPPVLEVVFRPAVTYAAGKNPIALAVADLNGDGEPDLATANHDSGDVSVLINVGDGSFAPAIAYPAGSGPMSVAVGDANGDELADLVVANFGSDDVTVALNQGGGAFAPAISVPAGKGPVSVVVGDVSGDGQPDLVTANRSDGNASVLLNKGKGTFATGVVFGLRSDAVSVSLAELDGDGRPDLVVGYDDGNLNVLLNSESGPFLPAVDYGAEPGLTFVAPGDLNGDGRVDLAVTVSGATTPGLPGSVRVFLNDGGGILRNESPIDCLTAIVFGYPAGNGAASGAVGDLNGDGWPDIAVANRADSTVSLLINRRHATFDGSDFESEVTVSVGTDPRAVAIGDLNGDGLADLAVAHASGVTVFVNSTR